MKNFLKKVLNKIFNTRERANKDDGKMKATDYGLFSNLVYALKKAYQYNKKFVMAVVICSLTDAAYVLLGTWLPKVVLSKVENNVPISELVLVTCIMGASMLLSKYLFGKADYQRDYEFDNLDYHLVNERIQKTFTTDYANMENPDFLDFTQRAKRANWWWSGFHGFYQRFHYILSQVLIVVITAVALSGLNIWIIIVLAVLSFGNYRIFDGTMARDKKLHNDALAPTYRKINYMERTTRNFDFAKDIRLFGMESWFAGIFKGLNKTYNDNYVKHHNRWIGCEVKMDVLILIRDGILYGSLIYSVLFNGMKISDFTLYVGLVNSFTKAFTDLFSNMSFTNLYTMHMNDYRTYMDWNESEPDMEKEEGTIKDINYSEYEFKFENVSFKYPGQDTYALKDINLTIKPGMKLAIVGINGAGKTTFTKLLMKLYDPTEGRILLNGIDLKQYDRESYFKIFSPIFQNVECFAFPVWENVSLTDEEHTDREKVKAALKQSGLDEKINKYEKGIDTHLLKIFDKQGIDLSGGEKQRLAMARALYKGGDVMVLDEPTAALDALAEDKMYREFNKIVEGKTSIFISHRLSSTRFCDCIAMFDEGKIIEYGTHDELMENNGKYANMYNIQAQYYRKGEKVNENA